MLRRRFGFQHWWPGESTDEIVIGAVLTQQTSWKNVEKALANLKRENALSINSISRIGQRKLERIIKPAGFYRQKARRLRNISASMIGQYGSLDAFLHMKKTDIRKALLEFDGIGNETADAIILYAADKRIFVIDAYTKRIISRVYGFEKDIGYEELQKTISENLKGREWIYKDFHAQFVRLGKEFCRTKPFCENCPLDEVCKSI